MLRWGLDVKGQGHIGAWWLKQAAEPHQGGVRLVPLSGCAAFGSCWVRGAWAYIKQVIRGSVVVVTSSRDQFNGLSDIFVLQPLLHSLSLHWLSMQETFDCDSS